MFVLIQRLLSKSAELIDRQPVLALVLGSALVALFLTIVVRREADQTGSVAGNLHRQLCRVLWGGLVVGMLAWSVFALRGYLEDTTIRYRHNHGRVTETNLRAVRTIWGAEQTQHELGVDLSWEEQEEERLESEDPTRPALIRKKKVRHSIDENPFVSARHMVRLKQNPRKKGSAFYAGYETGCRFTYNLKNPAKRKVDARFEFPLPGSRSMYDDLELKLDGKSVLAEVKIVRGALTVEREMAPGQETGMEVAFTSRGLSHWYLQLPGEREIRDFELVLELPDIAKEKVNYPEGCMPPTKLEPMADGVGCKLTYHLDRAIVNKGMGIALPYPEQPGQVERAVLWEAQKGWILLFAVILMGLTLSGNSYSALVTVLLGAMVACGFGLVADLSGTFLGFWGASALVWGPVYSILAISLWRLQSGPVCWTISVAAFLFGCVYPYVAGAADEHRTLYINLGALIFLLVTSWLLLRRFGRADLVKAGVRKRAPLPHPAACT